MSSSRTPAGERTENAATATPSMAEADALTPGPLLDALPGAVLITDGDGTIRYGNDAMHALLGFAPGALTGMPLTQLHPEALMEDILSDLQRVLGGTAPGAPVPSRLRASSGALVEVHIQSRPIQVDGRPFVLSSIDPIHHLAPSEAFTHRQWQLRLFSNLSSDYFYRSGLDDTANPVEIWPIERFTAITGYTREGVLEAGGWAHFIHPEDLSKLTHPHRLHPQDGAQRVEYRIRTASGETRWLRDSHQVVEDPESGAILVFGAVSDVTAQHAAMDAVQESETQLRRIFDAVSQSLALLDRDLRVMAANSKLSYDFERGYERTLELGRPFPEQLPPEWAEILVVNAEAVLQGEVRKEELLWHLPNGEQEWAAVQLNPIFEEDGVVGISMCVEGIHRRKMAELALQESESQLRGIFDTVSQGFVLLDRNFVVKAANRKLLDDYENSFGEPLHVGDCLLDKLPPAFNELLKEHMRPVLAGEQRVREVMFPIIGAEPEWNEVQMNPIIEDGVVTGISVCIEEIHRRKVAELALQESEGQLRRIFETVSQGFMLLDTDLRIQAANKRMLEEIERVFGRPLRIGELLTDLLPEDLQLMLADNVAATLQGERRTEEILFSLAIGGEEWGEIQLNPIFDNGQVVGISLCSDEIHRRKVAELALQESEAKLRRIFETVSQGFAMLDRDLRVEMANHQMLREYAILFGHELTIGSDFSAHLPDGWRKHFLVDAREALNGEYRYREYHFPESTTTSEWFEIEMNPIIENGEVVGISLCADEIHLRKKAEEALQQAYQAMEETVAERTRELQTAYDQLRESEERLRLIAERASDVIWHLDGQNRVWYMSPSFERVFGWSVAELKEKGIQIAFRPEKQAELTEAMDAHLEHWRKKRQHPPTFTHEVEYRHRDGTPFYAEVNMDFDFPDFEAWLETGDEALYPHILGVSRDRTEYRRQEAERRELEQQVLHAQKLESLGVMAGGIAHDFNNLLVGIMGYASLATMELPDDHAVQMYVKQIEAASQRAADLTQQMLAYSGRGQFVVQPVCVSSLTREMAHLLATVVSKKAQIDYELTEQLPTVRADATQLRQVVMNLITNASEALEEQVGVIRLATGACELSDRDLRPLLAAENAAPGAFVFIEVADSGCGMDAETLARVFEPFYTTKFTGRGLGLGAVHGIVRGHKGAIRVASELGAGTTVRVFLPVSDEPLPEPTPNQRIGSPAQGERVLVVDDEPSVREFARHALELGGYSVVEAANGREAIEILAREWAAIEGVLLDLTMPEMDGAETLKWMRAHAPNVPVVLSSGHAEKEVLASMGDETPFLHKPYHPDLLRQRMREALARGNS